MATIPIIDLPQQQLGAGGMQPFAAPGVEPVKNLAPEQMIKQGQAIQTAGQTALKIGDQMQDQIDDASVKAADSFFVSRAQKIMLDPEKGYLTTVGVRAKDQYEQTQKDLASLRDEAFQTLTSPVQQKMFNQAVQTHMLSLQSQMDRHVTQQVRVYAAGESEAREKQYVTMAVQDPAKRDQYLAVALNEARQRADLLQLPADSAQRKSMEIGAYNAFHTGVATQMILSDNFAGAKEYVDKAFKDEQLDLDSYTTLSKQIDVGYTKQQGIAAGEKIYQNKSVPARSDYASLTDWVISIEGGYVEDDAGAGPTNHGINAKAYFNVKDASELTQAQKDFIKNLSLDEARKIYKKNYWDKIDADKLPPEMRAVAFDAAVNQGVGWTKSALEKAGGDPAAFLQMRRERYQEIIANNPEKFQRYEKSWNSRLDKLEASLTGKTPSLSSLLAETNSIEDKEQRDIARATIIDQWNQEESVRKQDQLQTFNRAADIASQREGGWKDVPIDIWSKLTFEEQQSLIERRKTSDPDTVIMLQKDPNLWRPGIIEQYRGLLSESDYRKFLADGSEPAKVRKATIDNDILNNELLITGLDNLVAPTETDDKKSLITLRSAIKTAAEAEMEVKGRDLTLDETRAVIKRSVQKVKIEVERSVMNPARWVGDPTRLEERRLFEVEDPSQIFIPQETRDMIIRDFEKNNIQYSEMNVINAYLLMQSEAEQE